MNMSLPVISLVVAFISMVASFFTFYFTNVFPGELQVIFPDNVGFSYDLDRIYILIPITFANAGSARSRVQVNEIAATIKVLPNGPALHTRWDYAAYYLSNQEYYARYKEWVDKYKPNVKFDSEDQLMYEGRAVPFQVIGGAFISKLYRFAETEDAGLSADDLYGKDARLCLSVNYDEKLQSVPIKLPHMDSSQFNYVWVDTEKLSKEKCLAEAGAK